MEKREKELWEKMVRKESSEKELKELLVFYPSYKGREDKEKMECFKLGLNIRYEYLNEYQLYAIRTAEMLGLRFWDISTRISADSDWMLDVRNTRLGEKFDGEWINDPDFLVFLESKKQTIEDIYE